jgi:thiosulfate reductase cytochrome b subunit
MQMVKRAFALCITCSLIAFWCCTALAVPTEPDETAKFYAKAKTLQQNADIANERCMSCHGDSSINDKWRTDRGRKLQLYVDPVAYRNSVHGGQQCQSCHLGKNEAAFDTAPHQFKGKPAEKECSTCHGKFFEDIYNQTHESYHYKAIVKKGKEFTCSSCHDAHVFTLPSRTEDIPANIEQANKACIQCHSDLRGYEKLTDKKLLDQDMSHWFLPNKKQHFASVRCVDCHGMMGGTVVHTIEPVENIKVDCGRCHTEKTAITSTLYKYRSEQRAFSLLNKNVFDDSELVKKNKDAIAERKDRADSPFGFMNAGLLKNEYVIGITQSTMLNEGFFSAVIALLLVIAAHTAARVLGTRAVYGHGKEELMFPTAIRVWHWLNVLLFAALIVSGFAMHYSSIMDFKAAQYIHNLFAPALVVLWIWQVLYLAASGQIKQYAPGKGFIGALLKQTRYYVWGMFKGEHSPAGHSVDNRLNPLQKVAYVSVFFVALPVLILSGLALMFSAHLPEMIMGYDAKWLVSTVHVGVSFFLVLFVVVHLYLCTTGHSVFALIKSMVTGKAITHHPKK